MFRSWWEGQKYYQNRVFKCCVIHMNVKPLSSFWIGEEVWILECAVFFVLINYSCAVSRLLPTSDMKDQLTKIRSLCDIQEISWKPLFKTEHLYYIYILRGFKTSDDTFRLSYSIAFDCSICPFLGLFHSWLYLRGILHSAHMLRVVS